MEELATNGFVVLPLLDRAECAEMRARLMQDMASTRFGAFNSEKKRRTLNQVQYDMYSQNKYVLGGFGALAHPASFHVPVVRQLRMRAYQKFFKKIYTPLLERHGHDLMVHAVMDRVMIRPPGDEPTAESWHRDEAANIDADDLVFGGWINLDCETDSQHLQTFSCVPGEITVQTGGGFAPVRDRQQIEDYKQRKQVVKIPPGHMLVFDETLVHEVVGGKKDWVTVRLFTGFVVGKGRRALVDKILGDPKWQKKNKNSCGPKKLPHSLKELLERKTAPPIKSGQLPPFYPAATWSNPVLVRQLTGIYKDDKGKMKLDQYPALTYLYTGLKNATKEITAETDTVQQRCDDGVPCDPMNLLRSRTGAQGVKTPWGRVDLLTMRRFAGGSEASGLPDYAIYDRAILYPHKTRISRPRPVPLAAGQLDDDDDGDNVRPPKRRRTLVIDDDKDYEEGGRHNPITL